MWHQQSQRRPKLSHILVDFLSICDALLVLHNFSPSYVHQDIKPEVLFAIQDHSIDITMSFILEHSY
jgi:hypothetical protein